MMEGGREGEREREGERQANEEEKYWKGRKMQEGIKKKGDRTTNTRDGGEREGGKETEIETERQNQRQIYFD